MPHRFVSVLLLLAPLALSGVGCGPSVTLDGDLAHESLRQALDAWKSGAEPRSLQEAQPPIVVGDDAWSAGAKLVDYEILGEGRNDGMNLHCPVRITFERGGRQSTREVMYLISTSPVITVFRHDE